MGEMTFGLTFWALCALGLAAAAAYGTYFLDRAPSLARALVKTAFMTGFAAALGVAGAPFPLVLAPIASAFGDFFLAFNKRWLLPLGILSFLIAQLAYLLLFFFAWMFAGDIGPLWPRYILMGAVVVAALWFLVWIAPKLGWMAFGVIPYAFAITAMCLAALWLPWAGWPAMLGAVCFMVSDFVLAVELFHLPPDAPQRAATGHVVWWTYAAAQSLILLGFVSLAAAA